MKNKKRYLAMLMAAALTVSGIAWDVPFVYAGSVAAEEENDDGLEKAGAETSDLEPVGDTGYAELAYDYDYPLCGPDDTYVMIPDDEEYIGSSMGCWVTADDYEGEAAESVEITDVEVGIQYVYDESEEGKTETDQTIVDVTRNEDGGWNLRANEDGAERLYGEAEVKITYTAADSKEPTDYTITISVVSDKAYLAGDYEQGTDCMLPNAEKAVTDIRICHDYINDDGNRDYREDTDFTLEVGDDYDQNVITNVEVGGNDDPEARKTVTVTSGECGEVNIPVFCSKDGEVICEDNIYINVRTVYYTLLPNEEIDTDVLLGDSWTLDSSKWELTSYYVDEETQQNKDEVIEESEYELSIWEYDDNAWIPSEDESITRKGNWGTSVKICGTWLTEPGVGDELPADYWLYFDEIPYRVDFASDYGNWDYIFTDAPMELEVVSPEGTDDDPNNSLPEGSEVVWELDYWGNDGDPEIVKDWITGEVSTAAAGISAYTLTVDESKYDGETSGCWGRITARVMYEENEISSVSMDFEVREPEYEYSYPLSNQNEDQLLPGWACDIDANMECWVNTSKHVDEYWSTPIQDVEIVEEYSWTEDGEEKVGEGTILTVKPNENEDGSVNNWTLRANDQHNYGYAIVRITYEPVQNTIAASESESGAVPESEKLEAETEEIVVYVNSEIFSAEYQWPENTNCMLPNAELTIDDIRLYHDFVNEDGNNDSEYIEDFKLEIEEESFDESMVMVTADDEAKSVTIKSKENEGGTDFNLICTVDGDKVYSEWIGIEITNEYWTLLPHDAELEQLKENIQLGETYTFNPENWSLTCHYLDESGEQQEENAEAGTYTLRIEEWNDAWDTDESFDETVSTFPSTLTRVGNWGADIRIYGIWTPSEEESGEEEVGIPSDYWLNFDSIDYGVDFEYSYGGREKSYVFTDTPLTLTLTQDEDTQALPEGYTVEWNMDCWGNDGDRDLVDGWMSGEPSEDKSSYTLTVNKYDGKESGCWGWVQAVIYYEGNEIASVDMDFSVEEPRYDYDVPWIGTLLRGWDYKIEPTITCWLFDAEHLEDEYTAEVTDVVVTEEYDYDDKQQNTGTIVKLDGNATDGWTLHALSDGYAEIKITCQALENNGEEPKLKSETYTQTVNVSGEVLYFDFKYPENVDCMLPGSEMTITDFSLKRIYLDDNGEEQWEKFDDFTLAIDSKYDDENGGFATDDDGNPVPDYNTDLISAEVDNADRSITVTAKEGEEGDTDIGLCISYTSADGEKQEYHDGIHIRVCNEYSVVGPAVIYAQPGDTISADEIGGYIKYAYLDEEGNAQEEFIEGTEFTFESREEVNGITVSEDGKSLSIDEKFDPSESDPLESYQTVTVGLNAVSETEGWNESTDCRLVICNHVMEKGEVTTKATCEEAGETVYYCSNGCGYTETRNEPEPTDHNYDDGTITKAATCTAAGVKTYTCQNDPSHQRTETIPATGHKWGDWTTVSEATVFAPEKQERTCTVCKEKETRDNGKKLEPTIKVSASSLKMQTKQTTTSFKVTGMANGDYVKSVVSSNKKIVKVSNVTKTGTMKLAAQKKAGTAKLTITLASGKTKTVKVTVQNKAVKTTKISGLSKKATLKKGKTIQLTPIITPITSQDKVTYTSSKKKVATVTKKGLVKGKKAGKAKITVKSGKKKFVVTVTVK